MESLLNENIKLKNDKSIQENQHWTLVIKRYKSVLERLKLSMEYDEWNTFLSDLESILGLNNVKNQGKRDRMLHILSNIKTLHTQLQDHGLELDSSKQVQTSLDSELKSLQFKLENSLIKISSQESLLNQNELKQQRLESQVAAYASRLKDANQLTKTLVLELNTMKCEKSLPSETMELQELVCELIGKIKVQNTQLKKYELL